MAVPEWKRLEALSEVDRRGYMGPRQKAAFSELNRRWKKIIEPAATAVTSAIAEPVSGFAGLAAAPWGVDASVNAINKTQQGMTYQPKSEAGLQGLQALQKFMQPVGDAFEGASSYLGDAAYEATGSPALGAAAYSIPTVALEALGLKGAGKIPGKKLEFGDIGTGSVGSRQRGAISGMTEIKGAPDGRVLLNEEGSKLTFIETPEGRVQMYNPNREKWTDVTDMPVAENVRRKDAEIMSAGGLDSWKAKAESLRLQRDEAVKQYREEAASQADSYKVQHTAPMRDENPNASDLNSVMPDIYGPNGKRYFGTGAAYDDKALSVIRKMQGKPNSSVVIYRAVPEGVTDINSGDWITTTKEYAMDHIGSDSGYTVISKKVKAKDLANDGNSIHEFGYDPAN